MISVPVTIGNLNETFIIPDYQRGYRWGSVEVENLLNDVWEGADLQTGGRQYCLQSLTVQRNQDGEFEVIDGQQRLTTIYILFHIIKKTVASANVSFKLKYKNSSRQGVDAFLSAITGGKSTNINADFFHMEKVFMKINEWINTKAEISSIKVGSIVGALNLRLTNNVFFLLSEMPQNAGVHTTIKNFCDANLLSLNFTNAELIKAMLLNKKYCNFEKQQEIVVAWNKIEQTLNQDEFWYFLNAQDKSDTRIDLIFRTLAESWNIERKLNIDENDPRFSYIVLEKILKPSDKAASKNVNDIWREVEKTYDKFYSWYRDVDIYHLVGYLIHGAGKKSSYIYKLAHGARVSEFKKVLLQEAKDSLNTKIPFDANEVGNLNFGTDDAQIKKLLLFFNLASVFNAKHYRFPFDLYKKQKWDVGYIHEVVDKGGRRDTQSTFNDLGNLTLLSTSIIRDYKNVSFVKKRKKILDMDRRGIFVPLCTKNVFAKNYNDSVQNFPTWEDNDKSAYLKKMASILNSYIEKF